MCRLTIEDTDDTLDPRLRSLARNEVGDSLDHLIGTWTEAEEIEFLRALEPFERVATGADLVSFDQHLAEDDDLVSIVPDGP